MVAPSGEGAVRCMRLAMKSLGNTPVDYINAHGTSTPVGDITELKAIREAFGADMPRVSSTKSLTGHSQGATGVHEAIYSLLMMDNKFVAASANIANLDPEAEGMPIVRAVEEDVQLTCVMSKGFGLGGTTARLAFQSFEGSQGRHGGSPAWGDRSEERG